MEVKNCRTCGRLFNYLGGKTICPACVAKLEDKYQEVRDYIRSNPKVPLLQISEDNDVPVSQIKQWIREERLVFTEDSAVGIECENCGVMIRTGRFCLKCKDHISNSLEDVYRKPEEELKISKKVQREKERMRFLDKQ